jgi:phospholipid/cholesterol/gamma-HCH transport system substrate-binding protein
LSGVKKLEWRGVRGGMLALLVIVAALIATFRYAGTGGLHGSRFTLYIAAPDAYNLLRGSDVWLNGQRVGVVREITYNRPSAPLDARVVIRVDVLSDVRGLIRLDSHASLRNGGTVIGAPVVYLTAGSLRSRRVVPGDTLRAPDNTDLENAASRVTLAAQELPRIADDGKAIVSNIQVTRQRMAQLLGGAPSGQTFGATASSFIGKLSRGNGSAARMMNDQQLRARIERSLAAMDTMRTLLAGVAPRAGRFGRDSTLPRSVASLHDDVAQLRAMAASRDGTPGRVAADSALRRSLDSAFVELTALLADIKAHPLKYSRVF